MRGFRRLEDATFEVNFAPFLGIIISIIPMLLVGFVFMEIQFIETPIPQIVAEHTANQEQSPDPVTQLSLAVDKEKGFIFTIAEPRKRAETITVALNEGDLDYEALVESTVAIKNRFTDIFKMSLNPGPNVSFDEIVQTMDSVRVIPSEHPPVAFVDSNSGEEYETDLMFPDVTFGNVVGGP